MNVVSMTGAALMLIGTVTVPVVTVPSEALSVTESAPVGSLPPGSNVPVKTKVLPFTAGAVAAPFAASGATTV